MKSSNCLVLTSMHLLLSNHLPMRTGLHLRIIIVIIFDLCLTRHHFFGGHKYKVLKYCDWRKNIPLSGFKWSSPLKQCSLELSESSHTTSPYILIDLQRAIKKQHKPVAAAFFETLLTLWFCILFSIQLLTRRLKLIPLNPNRSIFFIGNQIRDVYK